MSSTLPRRLLHATFASLRCRELYDSGKLMEARIELDLLRQALGDLHGLKADQQCQREIDFLRAQERKLTTMLESARSTRRSRPPDAPSGAP